MAPDAIITLHTGGHKWVGGDNMNMDGEAVSVVIIVKAWSEIVLLRSIVRKLTYTLGLISIKGGKW